MSAGNTDMKELNKRILNFVSEGSELLLFLDDHLGHTKSNSERDVLRELRQVLQKLTTTFHSAWKGD